MRKHIILNENNNQMVDFNKLKGKNNMLLKFYSNNCGYCKEMEPEWNNAMNQLKEKNPKKLLIIEVESDKLHNFKDENNEIKQNIMGYPTIMFVSSNNKVFNFDNERTSDNFVNFTIQNIPNSINLMKKKLRKTRKRKTRANLSKKHKKSNKKKGKSRTKKVRFNV